MVYLKSDVMTGAGTAKSILQEVAKAGKYTTFLSYRKSGGMVAGHVRWWNHVQFLEKMGVLKVEMGTQDDFPKTYRQNLVLERSEP